MQLRTNEIDVQLHTNKSKKVKTDSPYFSAFLASSSENKVQNNQKVRPYATAGVKQKHTKKRMQKGLLNARPFPPLIFQTYYGSTCQQKLAPHKMK